MESQNSFFEVAGEKQQCEADEVAFRCISETRDGVQGVTWLRYIAVVRRRSFRLFLGLLPERWVPVSGKGGGGALSIQEMVDVLRCDTSKPVLKARSLLHTDSAKAYKRLGPLQWPVLGALHENDVFKSRETLSVHEYTRTSVCHKRKVVQRVQFSFPRTHLLGRVFARSAWRNAIL